MSSRHSRRVARGVGPPYSAPMAKPIQRSTPISGRAARELLKSFDTPPNPKVVQRRASEARAFLAKVRAPKLQGRRAATGPKGR